MKANSLEVISHFNLRDVNCGYSRSKTERGKVRSGGAGL